MCVCDGRDSMFVYVSVCVVCDESVGEMRLGGKEGSLSSVWYLSTLYAHILVG
jgi:hypothetical protein